VPGGPGRRATSVRMMPGDRVESDRPAAHARQVLLVDDDDDSAALLTSHLDRLGHIVLRARSAEEGLEIAATMPVDLIVADLLLPGMTGWELVGALRDDAATSHCPVVVSSVLDRQDYPDGVQGTLPKPYTRRQVEQLLRRLLPT
jgi:CheY-like chemotaxis protein